MAKKYVVLNCLRALGNVGYNIPSFSSMMIRALDEGVRHDVAGLCATVAQHKQFDVVRSKRIL